MRKFLIVPVLAGGLALAAAGCQVEKTVGSGTVEKQIDAKFGPMYQAAGLGPAKASCPGDLKGKVGTTLDCTVRDGKGGSHRLTVTVTSVKGSEVHFSMRAAS
ncbi:DUF4333 domain-containing protein [Actinomadura nitritigenes]|jgi:hypothetical protein|uniref:DUF4333 domain-containing protein n=1 Tax=Actinomadura TaxID=1988 RepID=UPI0016852259|nr:DUF4333 domain-containing protein [Actinomadura sp. RB99]MBD2893919.1 hypothetical protein [Actinomadura sp. RB99]